MSSERRSRLLTLGCFLVLYVVWGSTYLAQRVAVQSFPPLQMAALRFLAGGSLLYAILRARGVPAPDREGWKASATAALPLMVLGMGSAAIALKRVPSGMAALVFASVPLTASLLDKLWGGAIRRLEAVGLAVGLAGVVLVASRGGLGGDPRGAALLLFAASSYALGCVLNRRLRLPGGGMAVAAEMLVAGAVLFVVSAGTGDRFSMPSSASILAMAHLVLFGSVLAYSAFFYLLKHTTAAMATSYAYVNPIVALLLGVAAGGEHVTPADLLGLALVLGAVVCTTLGARAPRQLRVKASAASEEATTVA